MKSILLIGPYNPSFRQGQFPSPPLGIYRLASYLKNKAIADVDVVDPCLDVQEVYSMLGEKKYDFIGHSVLQPTMKHDLKIIFDADEIQPSAIKIAGGQGASFNQSFLLKKTPISIVVRGFGEHALEKIISSTSNLYDNIPGLFLKDKSESCFANYVETEKYSQQKLDEFRETSLHLDINKIPYERYWKLAGTRYNAAHFSMMKNVGMEKTIRLITSNYCPLGCTFCSSTNFLNEGCDEKQKMLQLLPEDVIHLMKRAVSSHPDANAFYFNDDDFLLNKPRLERFCSLMDDEKLSGEYNLMCMARVDDVDKTSLAWLKHVGFNILFFGVETFSNSLAKKIGKIRSGDYESVARRSIIETLDAGITAQISLMIFLPDSIYKDLELTIENSVDLMMRGARLTVFPYVEAYAGAMITDKHDLSYATFDINGSTFELPEYVLPDASDMRLLARESMLLKEKFNRSFQDKYHFEFGGLVPQPVDGLNLFLAIYSLLGKKTESITDVLNSMIRK